MALRINLPDQYGNGGVEHWSVIETNINWLNRTAHVVLAGWVNEKAKTDGKQPLDSKSYDYDSATFPFDEEALKGEGVSTRTVAYAEIKAPKIEDGKDLNVFSSAVDI